MIKHTTVAFLACALVLSLASCDFLNSLLGIEDDPADSSLPTISTISTATTTAKGNYAITDGFYVNATWTIAPGTTIYVDPDEWIDVTASGQIIAQGTAAEPITFVSSKAVKARGDWNGIVDDGNGSVYTYCIIKHADTALIANGSLVTIEHCAFEANTNGLDLDELLSATAFGSNAFTDNGEPLSFNDNVELDDTNTFSGNTYQRARFTVNAVESPRSWTIRSVPIYADGFWVEASLSIGAGVTLNMAPDAWIEFQPGGTLSVTGTSTSPVTIQSALSSPAAGDWNGIIISQTGSSLEYCFIHHADIGLDIDVDGFTLANSTITGNTVDIDYTDTDSWAIAGTNTYSTSNP